MPQQESSRERERFLWVESTRSLATVRTVKLRAREEVTCVLSACGGPAAVWRPNSADGEREP